MVALIIVIEGIVSAITRLIGRLGYPYYISGIPIWSYQALHMMEFVPKAISASASLLVACVWLKISVVELGMLPSSAMWMIRVVAFCCCCIPTILVPFFASQISYTYSQNNIYDLTLDLNGKSAASERKAK